MFEIDLLPFASGLLSPVDIAAAAGEDRLYVAEQVKGPATTQANLGNPTTSAAYAFCLYAGSSANQVASAAVAAAGTCAGKPCRKVVGTKGYTYKDKDASSDGAFVMKLLAGEPGKSKILFKAKGSNLDL